VVLSARDDGLTDRRTRTEDGCIQDGPFRDLTLRMSRESNHANYCLSRSFDQQWFTWANRSNVEECFIMTEYDAAWQCYNEFPHSAGHAVVGGVVRPPVSCFMDPSGEAAELTVTCLHFLEQMGDPIESSGDPIFFLHHAYLDRLWWQWQQADEANRLTAIGGVNVPPQSILDLVGLQGPDPSVVDYNGDEGDTTTLRHVLWLHGIVPNVTVADVLDLGGEVICATYE
jgi:tyrosinase